MDVVEEYLNNLLARLGAELSRLAPRLGSSRIEQLVDLPTHLSLGAHVVGDEVTEWSIVYRPNSERAEIAGGRAPQLGAQLLASSVDRGDFDFLSAKIHDLTVGLLESDGFSPTFSCGLLASPPWEPGSKGDVAPLSVADLLRGTTHALLVGPVGSGKSTTLRLFARRLAQEYRLEHGRPLPLFLNLRSAAGALDEACSRPGDLGLDELCQILTAEWRLPPSFADAMKDLWFEGRTVLLLDGYDELGVALPRQAAMRVREELTAFVSDRTVTDMRRVAIASRPDVEFTAVAAFTPIELAPLTLVETVDLLYHLVGPMAASAVQTDAVARIPSDLRSRPLFVTLIAGIILAGGSARELSRAELLEHGLQRLLDDRVAGKRSADDFADIVGCTYEAFVRVLQRLAFESLAKSDAAGAVRSASAVSLGHLMEELHDLSDEIDISAAVNVLTRDSGLLIADGADLHFTHRIFQELLAADHAISVRREDRTYSTLLDEFVASPGPFREVARLAVERLVMERDVNRLLDLCTSAIDRATGGAASIRNASLTWLAAIGIQGARDLDVELLPRDLVVLDAFRNLAPAFIGAIDVLQLRERVEIARLLGDIGDPRPGVGLSDGIPDVEWVNVPGGEMSIGLSTADLDRMPAAWRARTDREIPSQRVGVEEFAISQYPVTWTQFDAFLLDQGGYESPLWWSELEQPADLIGERALELRSRRRRGSEPARGVDWFEAVAFCRWLSSRIGRSVRLPTEAEWERAARGESGALYPWGPSFESANLNWEGAGVGEVVPVGCFASKSTPWTGGPSDMLGNVWEWTSTIAGVLGADDLPPPGTEIAAPSGVPLRMIRRIVRGGCYFNTEAMLRSSFRGMDPASARYERQGFRVVLHGS